MDDIQKIIPVTTMKKNFLNIIKDMADEDSTVTVTKNGVAVGVMITPDRYIGLLETIEILSSPGILKALNASERDFKAGKIYTHKDIWTEKCPGSSRCSTLKLLEIRSKNYIPA